jgi:hypothetical protein
LETLRAFGAVLVLVVLVMSVFLRSDDWNV